MQLLLFAGRLIHPNTKSGPRKEVVNCWEEKFRGWWKNDDAVHSLKHRKYAEWQSDRLDEERVLANLIDFQSSQNVTSIDCF